MNGIQAVVVAAAAAAEGGGYGAPPKGAGRGKKEATAEKHDAAVVLPGFPVQKVRETLHLAADLFSPACLVACLLCLLCLLCLP